MFRHLRAIVREHLCPCEYVKTKAAMYGLQLRELVCSVCRFEVHNPAMHGTNIKIYIYKFLHMCNVFCSIRTKCVKYLTPLTIQFIATKGHGSLFVISIIHHLSNHIKGFYLDISPVYQFIEVTT
jgi:hypothetical protein